MLNTFLLVEMQKNKVHSRVVPYLKSNWRWGKAVFDQMTCHIMPNFSVHRTMQMTILPYFYHVALESLTLSLQTMAKNNFILNIFSMLGDMDMVISTLSIGAVMVKNMINGYLVLKRKIVKPCHYSFHT